MWTKVDMQYQLNLLYTNVYGSHILLLFVTSMHVCIV
jgi:hypothetical protein